MKHFRLLVLCLTAVMIAQPAVAQNKQAPAAQAETVSKSVPAVNYKVLGGNTKVDLVGTPLMPSAQGDAKVQSKAGYARIEAQVENLESPLKFGSEYLTYVLWAVSTQGATRNLGEFLLDDGKSKLQVTTNQQVFALAVTAEPYFSVRQPSDVVVLVNQVRKKTKGSVFLVDTKTELLRRGHYASLSNPLGLTLDLKSYPLELYEARNALEIAKGSGAEKYASEVYSRAKASLEMADRAVQEKKEKKDVATFARQTVQFAEDSRALSVERQAQEAQEQQRAAKEAAEDAAQKAELQAQRAATEQAQAELQAERAAAQQAQAEADRAKAEAAEQDAQRQAAESRAAAAQAEQEKAELRARLLKQFNTVLETRDTARGLVVNMGDVLFDTGKYNLRPEAREKLARLAGIVLNYPSLKLQAEGHTDSTGGEEFNQKLSEQRAQAVQEYLATQGIPADSLGSIGLGMTAPIAPNNTSKGRQQNRRVEIIVSGEVIGNKIGS